MTTKLQHLYLVSYTLPTIVVQIQGLNKTTS